MDGSVTEAKEQRLAPTSNKLIVYTKVCSISIYLTRKNYTVVERMGMQQKDTQHWHVNCVQNAAGYEFIKTKLRNQTKL